MNLETLLDFNQTIQVMDIGAACIAEAPVYNPLLDRGLAHLHAFEGDARQVALIEQTYGHKASIHCDFVADGTLRTLYIASPESGMTSLLKPELAALKFFNYFVHFGKVLKTEEVQTRRLDDVEGIPQIDFLKMDIQGSELCVLENGPKTLQACIAIQLEVSWICLYENQPGFGEIDCWMRSKGYAPHCMLDVKKWSIAPTIKNNNFRLPFNQLLESDIVYIRDPLNLELLDTTQLLKMALIVHYCLNSFDLCVFVLLELIRRGVLPPDTHYRYLTLLPTTSN